MKPRIDPDDLKCGICDSCGAYVRAELVDCGIGPYEYWGAKGYHEDWHALSPCCSADVVDGGEVVKRITMHVARKDHADGKVKKGDTYRKTVLHRWRRGGPGWYVVVKKVTETAAFKTHCFYPDYPGSYDYRCTVCDCKPWHKAADKPCERGF